MNRARIVEAVDLQRYFALPGSGLLAPPRHTRSIFMEGYKEMRVGFRARG